MRRSLVLYIAALGAVALAAGCGSTNPSADTATAATKRTQAIQAPLPAGRIAFRRFFDDAQTHGAVFTINPDGTGEKQITDPPAGFVDDQPDWSPDGKRIAFERCSERKGCTAWTVAANGGAPQKLRVRCQLKPVCDVESPSWTRDGRLVVGLAQGRERNHGQMHQIQQFSIELIDPARGTQHTVIKRTAWTGDTHTPAASPDGHTVVYKRWNSWRTKPVDGQALYVVNLDGSNNHRVTPWSLRAGDHPGFSPDGSTILFRSHEEQETKQSDFWTVHPDGSALTRLTHVKDGTLVRSASYSPDGAWIVHATDGVGGNADIFVMRADGTGNQPVTRTKLWDSAPDWGPASS
jgi:TolB protein